MLLNWYPVDPTLVKGTGAFAMFAGDAEADRLKPMPLGADKTPFSIIDWEQGEVSIDFAAKLGFGPFFQADAKYSSRCFRYELMAYTDEESHGDPIGGRIYGTRWGAGMRVVAAIQSADLKVGGGFAAFAAAAELSVSKGFFSIKTYGLGTDVIEVLPEPQTLNVESYGKIMESVSKVKKHLNKEKEKLQQVALAIRMITNPDQTPVDNARAVAYAMRKIKFQRPMRVALNDARDMGVAEDVVRQIYERFADANAEGVPSDTAASRAVSWLGY